MQVIPGGYREPLNFELQQACPGSIGALDAMQTNPVPNNKVSSCSAMQLKASEYGCTEEQEARELLPKVRMRGLTSF